MSADFAPEERAELGLAALRNCPDPIPTLQALQRLVQEELARLWAEQNDSPELKEAKE